MMDLVWHAFLESQSLSWLSNSPTINQFVLQSAAHLSAVLPLRLLVHSVISSSALRLSSLKTL